MISLLVAGWYDVPEGMVFNFPARLLPAGRYDVVQDIELSDETKSKLKESVDVRDHSVQLCLCLKLL